MSRVIRAAVFQTAWTGDKGSMIQVHEQAARDEAAQGAQVLCFQELFNPSATSRGLSRYLWQLEQPAAAVANEYFIGAINRVGVEGLGDNDFYGTSYFVDPEAQFVGEVASDKETELVVRELDLAKLREVRDRWQFYRDRRPETYTPLTAP